MIRPLPYIADCEDHDAELAELFNIHAALVSAERTRPDLRKSPRWSAFRTSIDEALWREMEGKQ